MDKEQFIEIIDKLEKLNEEQEKFDAILRMVDPEFGGRIYS